MQPNPPTLAARLAAVKACVTGCGCDSVVCHGHEWDDAALTALLAADPPGATVEIVCDCGSTDRDCPDWTPTTARVSYERALTEEER